MKLSKSLLELSRLSPGDTYTMKLLAASGAAERLEKNQDILVSDVTDFHTKFGHPVSRAPVQMVPDLAFRKALIQEEVQELCTAIDEGDLAAIAAEAVDLIYVVVGTLVVLGLPLLPFWRNVHRANMKKYPNPAGGKPLKSEDWVSPNPRGILYGIRRESR